MVCFARATSRTCLYSIFVWTFALLGVLLESPQQCHLADWRLRGLWNSDHPNRSLFTTREGLGSIVNNTPTTPSLPQKKNLKASLLRAAESRVGQVEGLPLEMPFAVHLKNPQQQSATGTSTLHGHKTLVVWFAVRLLQQTKAQKLLSHDGKATPKWPCKSHAFSSKMMVFKACWVEEGYIYRSMINIRGCFHGSFVASCGHWWTIVRSLIDSEAVFHRTREELAPSDPNVLAKHAIRVPWG